MTTHGPDSPSEPPLPHASSPQHDESDGSSPEAEREICTAPSEREQTAPSSGACLDSPPLREGSDLGATPSGDGPPADLEQPRPSPRVRAWSGTWVLAGLLVPTAIGVLCVAAESTSALSACGGALIVGGGGFGVGWLIGFIFGLPKMIGQAGGQLQANTNLEKISDWLPTAVLGASAVQADAIREAIVAIGKSMHEACTLPAPMIEGVLVVSLVAGFIAGWLAARLHLNKSMLNSDLDAAALGPVTPNLQGQPGKDQDA